MVGLVDTSCGLAGSPWAANRLFTMGAAVFVSDTFRFPAAVSIASKPPAGTVSEPSELSFTFRPWLRQHRLQRRVGGLQLGGGLGYRDRGRSAEASVNDRGEQRVLDGGAGRAGLAAGDRLLDGRAGDQRMETAGGQVTDVVEAPVAEARVPGLEADTGRDGSLQVGVVDRLGDRRGGGADDARLRTTSRSWS